MLLVYCVCLSLVCEKSDYLIIFYYIQGCTKVNYETYQLYPMYQLYECLFKKFRDIKNADHTQLLYHTDSMISVNNNKISLDPKAKECDFVVFIELCKKHFP